tara:strand:+ start:8523 stop:8726 length:204 start_codon:yes stop_codon:yes gene_type:complete
MSTTLAWLNPLVLVTGSRPDEVLIHPVSKTAESSVADIAFIAFIPFVGCMNIISSKKGASKAPCEVF